MDKKTVIIAGNFFFPDKNAAGKYNLSYGLMLKEIGYNPVFIGTDNNISYSDNIEDTYKNFQEMDSYAMPYPKKATDWGKNRSQFNRFLSIVNKYDTNDIKAIIVFGSPSFSIWTKVVRKWSIRNNINFIAHCAEGVRFTRRGLFYSFIRGLDEIYHKKILIPKADGVIVGGPLLYDYFNRKQCNTIMFPTISDTKVHENRIQKALEELYSNENAVKKKNFIYAGSPFDIDGKSKRNQFKDRLDKTLELFFKVYEITDNFVLNIYGLTKEEYLKHVPEHKENLLNMNNHIVFHGRVDYKSVINSIIYSDFYIFHRDVTRITQSAFPTKGSESVTLGVPVITNKTSNIFDYIKEGQTGFMINDSNEVQKITNLIKFTNQEVLKIRENCFKDKTFDYRNNAPKFKEFIHNL